MYFTFCVSTVAPEVAPQCKAMNASEPHGGGGGPHMSGPRSSQDTFWDRASCRRARPFEGSMKREVFESAPLHVGSEGEARGCSHLRGSEWTLVSTRRAKSDTAEGMS